MNLQNHNNKETAADSPHYSPPRSPLRHSLNMVYFAWGFGSFWMYVTTGAAFTEFGKQLGFTDQQFGLLTSISFATAFIQLPASYIIERFGDRKYIFLFTAMIWRGMWLPMALIPWVMPKDLWVISLLISTAVTMLAANISIPAWTNWTADLVPSSLRGRYFSKRLHLGQFIGLIVSLAVGFGLDYAKAFDDNTLRITISLAFIIASVMGMIDICFHFTVMPLRKEPKPYIKWVHLLTEPLKDKSFRHYIAYTATLFFAVGFVPHYVTLYVRDVVAADAHRKFLIINTTTIAIPMIVSLISIPIWGRLITRLGNKPVLFISGCLIIAGGIGWPLVQPGFWLLGYPLVIISVTGWPGVQLAGFNILLGMSQTKNSKVGSPGSAFIAINSLATAVAGTLSGLFAAAVVSFWDRHIGTGNSITILGWPVTYHSVLFTISSFLRALALLWLIGLHEPTSHTTRAALRYIGTNIYSNVIQGLFLPARIVGRFSYRVNGKKTNENDTKPTENDEKHNEQNDHFDDFTN